jgi:NitT/TauT family transport system ATP-binding protein
LLQERQENGVRPKLTAISKTIPGFEKPILQIDRLRKVFEVGGSFLTVLDGLDFRVKSGEMICILGRSGCGKTTLLKMLAGFVAPSSGAIRLNGKPVLKPGPDRCVVFQEDTLFPWLTVKENIAFGLKGRKTDKKAFREEVERFLSLVGLSEFRDYLPREISGGMKQRVALARVLILKPKVLLMDEPFASLDAQTREEMQNLLLSLWEAFSHTILFVTHDVTEAVSLADRILVMRKDPGRISDDIQVDLPRPRKREKSDFLFFSRKLYESLRS